MSKLKRGVSKSRQVQRKHNKLPLIMALAGAAILLIAAFFAFQKKPTSFTPEVTGSPSLKADKEKVDLGDVKSGMWVTSLSNFPRLPLSKSRRGVDLPLLSSVR